VSAAVSDGKGGGAFVTISGAAEARRTWPARVYLEYPVDSFDGYSVEVTPDLAPAGARFGAVWTQPCGAGIYNDIPGDGGVPSAGAFAFCWDSRAEASTVLDQADTTCRPIVDSYGGRGTQCSKPYAWSVGEAYKFDLETLHPVAGHTDYAFYVTPVATGVRTKIVEFRFGSADRPSAAFSYLQEGVTGASCLQTTRQAARFRNVEKLDGDVASDVLSATFTRDYDVSTNSICANYAYGASEGAFFLSTGSDRVGPPLPPGWPSPVIALR
jgi:hypothetical protein